jgi:hypothetical protein
MSIRSVRRSGGRRSHQYGIHLKLVKHIRFKRGFSPMPRRWEVRLGRALSSFGRDHARLSQPLSGFDYCVFACLMLANLFKSLTKVNKSLPISCTQSGPRTLYERLSGHSPSRSRACSVIGNEVRRRTAMTGAVSFEP